MSTEREKELEQEIERLKALPANEWRISYRQDGTYWCAGDRERKITTDQVVRLLAYVWSTAASNMYLCESSYIFRKVPS